MSMWPACSPNDNPCVKTTNLFLQCSHWDCLCYIKYDRGSNNGHANNPGFHQNNSTCIQQLLFFQLLLFLASARLAIFSELHKKHFGLSDTISM